MTHFKTILTPDFQRLCWAVFLFFLGMHFLAPIVPVYFQQQGFEGLPLGLLLGTFLVVSLLLRPWVGAASDTRSPKTLMLWGIGLSIIAPLGYAFLSPWPWTLWLIRVVHGAAFALFYTAATGYLMRSVPAAYKAEAIGYYSNAVKVALAFSPGMAMIAMQRWGMMSTFVMTSLLSVLVLAVILPMPQQPANATPKTESPETIPPGRTILGLHVNALPLSAIMMTQSAVFGALIPFIAMLATEKHLHYSGWFYAVYALSLVATRFVTGSWSDQLGRHLILVPSMAMVSVSLLFLAWAPNDITFLLATAAYGLAAGAVQPSIMALISERVSAREQSTAMATFAVFSDIGIALGNVVMATVGFAFSYGWGLVAIGGITAIGLAAMVAETILHEPALPRLAKRYALALRGPVLAFRRRYR